MSFYYVICHLTKLNHLDRKDQNKDIVSKKVEETLILVIVNHLRLCGIMDLE